MPIYDFPLQINEFIETYKARYLHVIAMATEMVVGSF